MIKGRPELIAQITSFSRPAIYNYFETKEEIFLALFQREYDRWNEDLTAILGGNEQQAGTAEYLQTKTSAEWQEAAADEDYNGLGEELIRL